MTGRKFYPPKMDHLTPVGWELKCVRCGYDLHRSPKRCPECGTPAAETVRIVMDRARQWWLGREAGRWVISTVTTGGGAAFFAILLHVHFYGHPSTRLSSNDPDLIWVYRLEVALVAAMSALAVACLVQACRVLRRNRS